MTSPLLALFVRSLREDARGQATYWTRGALGVLLLLMMFGFAASLRWTNAPGRTFFTTVIVSQLIAISFVGLSFFASAIAEEKEEQTLGLLRMTGLSSLSILLGKSTSRLCGALLLLVAQFPFTIIAVTLGGVSFRQVAAVYCTLGAFIFLLCNVALLGSVLARRNAGAAAFSLVVVALLLALGPLLRQVPALWRDFLGVGPALDRAADLLWRATPIARLQEVLGTGFGGAVAGWQVASNLALGAGCFLLAWAAFERYCDRAPEAAASDAIAPPRFFGLRLSRPPRPWKDALAWKDFYFLCGGHAAFALRTVAYGSALLPFLYKSSGTLAQFGNFSSMFAVILPFVFSIDVATMASRIFRLELRDQTLAALATLPLDIRQIAYRKTFACLLAAAPGILSTMTVQFLTVQRSLASGARMSGMIPMIPMWLSKVGSSWAMGLLIVHVVAWLSLYLKRGALPVGYLLVYVAQILFSIFFVALFAARRFASYSVATSSGSVSSGGISFIFWGPLLAAAASVVVAIVLHFHALRRLEALAGES